MNENSWSPESLGVPDRQNFRLWMDMERAYGFIETSARYSISGNLEGFLFELIRRRWNLACANLFEPPPERSQKYNSTTRDNFMSVAPTKLAALNINKLSLSTGFAENFKNFADTLPLSVVQSSEGKLFGYGTDGYGTYIPLHLVWPEKKNYWGIYISETGILNLAANLYINLPKGQLILFPLAYQIILRHQLFHFKIEQWALLFEFASGRAYYLPYLQDVYIPTMYDSEENNLEEALANTSILLSKKIQKIQKDGNLEDTRDTILHFLSQQGSNYKNYDLKIGVPENIKQSDRELHYREVVNFLCNQIIRHEIRPKDPLVPYYLYPPNNNFLRAENLCPIYLVRNLPYQVGVIT